MSVRSLICIVDGRVYFTCLRGNENFALKLFFPEKKLPIVPALKRVSVQTLIPIAWLAGHDNSSTDFIASFCSDYIYL